MHDLWNYAKRRYTVEPKSTDNGNDDGDGSVDDDALINTVSTCTSTS